MILTKHTQIISIEIQISKSTRGNKKEVLLGTVNGVIIIVVGAAAAAAAAAALAAVILFCKVFCALFKAVIFASDILSSEVSEWRFCFRFSF